MRTEPRALAAVPTTPPVRLVGSGLTDVGRIRDTNEDSIFVDDVLGLYVVSDGMGGHARGDLASTATVATVVAYLDGRRDVLLAAQRRSDPLFVSDLVTKAFDAACDTLQNLVSADGQLAGMGCTLTALVWAGDHVVVAHVGDSRAYRLRDGVLTQLTEDHTLLRILERMGDRAPKYLDRHSSAHVLTRAIVAGRRVEPDVHAVELREADRFLLCTDGLTGYLGRSPRLLAHILAYETPSTAPAALIVRANAAGGEDNVSVVVVEAA